MKSIAVANSSWSVSAVALGNMRMGNLIVEEAQKVLAVTKDSGINYIDSADIYGGGQSEIVLGQALKSGSITRDDFYIQSKAGISKGDGKDPVYGKRFNFRKDYIVQSVDGILKRLQTDYLDAFLLHRPDALMDVHEVAEAFQTLEATGKVRHFGVSNFSKLQYEWLQKNLPQKLMFNQLQFSLMHSDMIDAGLLVNGNMDYPNNGAEDLLEHAQLHEYTIQAWSPFQYGMIKGVFIDNPDFPEVNKKLAEIAEKYGVGKNAVAAAWILKHPANIQVIVGSMTPERIQDTAKAMTFELTDQEWYDLYLSTGKILP